MNCKSVVSCDAHVSAGCHINDVMNIFRRSKNHNVVSAGCHINDVMNRRASGGH